MSISGNRQNIYTREQAKCLYQGTGNMSISGERQSVYPRDRSNVYTREQAKSSSRIRFLFCPLMPFITSLSAALTIKCQMVELSVNSGLQKPS